MKTLSFNILGIYDAFHRCDVTGNSLWYGKHEERLNTVLNEHLPHGSGIDSKWDFDFSSPEKILLHNSFHVMDENGYYNGYIDFSIVIKAKSRDIFGNIDFIIKGKFGRNGDIKDYLYDIFNCAFSDIDSLENV